MITEQIFHRMYPDLVSFNAGTYTRVRNGKTEIVKKKKRGAGFYAGGGALLGGGIVSIADTISGKIQANKLKKAGKVNATGLYFPGNGKLPHYKNELGFMTGNQNNLQRVALLGAAPLLAGAAVGYGVYKYKNRKKRK